MTTTTPGHVLGRNLRAAREARGWSRQTLKELSHTSTRAIADAELKGKEPRLSTLYAWAKALGIEACDLLP